MLWKKWLKAPSRLVVVHRFVNAFVVYVFIEKYSVIVVNTLLPLSFKHLLLINNRLKKSPVLHKLSTTRAVTKTSLARAIK